MTLYEVVHNLHNAIDALKRSFIESIDEIVEKLKGGAE